MRRRAVVEGCLLVVAGTLLHFAYEWSGENRWVGLISPVNESVWEHTKLYAVPIVVLGALDVLRRAAPARRAAWATLVLSLVGPLAIVAIFYTYTGAFGVAAVLVVDIASFIGVVFAGQWLRLGLLAQPDPPPSWVSGAGLVAVAALFVLLTTAPPDLPLFTAP